MFDDPLFLGGVSDELYIMGGNPYGLYNNGALNILGRTLDKVGYKVKYFVKITKSGGSGTEFYTLLNDNNLYYSTIDNTIGSYIDTSITCISSIGSGDVGVSALALNIMGDICYLSGKNITRTAYSNFKKVYFSSTYSNKEAVAFAISNSNVLYYSTNGKDFYNANIMDTIKIAFGGIINTKSGSKYAVAITTDGDVYTTNTLNSWTKSTYFNKSAATGAFLIFHDGHGYCNFIIITTDGDLYQSTNGFNFSKLNHPDLNKNCVCTNTTHHDESTYDVYVLLKSGKIAYLRGSKNNAPLALTYVSLNTLENVEGVFKNIESPWGNNSYAIAKTKTGKYYIINDNFNTEI